MFEYLSGGGLAGADDGSLLAQGLAMRDALVSDLRRIDDCRVTCANGPISADESALEFVARQAASHDRVWVIAPETAGTLEHLHDAVGGARWIGCNAAAIRVAASKRATLEVLARHGVATPLALAGSATRWVVKPDDGAGAVDNRIHASRDDAQADSLRRETPATIEPWAQGEPLSLSLLCAGGEAELLSINRQRIEVDPHGNVAYRGVIIDAIGRNDARALPLRAMASRVAGALPGLRGFVGVDLVWHAELGPVAVEVNPRLTCAYVGLSAALGRNLAAEVLALHG